MPSELIKEFEDARKVFKAGSKFTENAIKYYTFDEYVTDYAEIKQVCSAYVLFTVCYEGFVDCDLVQWTLLRKTLMIEFLFK